MKEKRKNEKGGARECRKPLLSSSSPVADGRQASKETKKGENLKQKHVTKRGNTATKRNKKTDTRHPQRDWQHTFENLLEQCFGSDFSGQAADRGKWQAAGARFLARCIREVGGAHPTPLDLPKRPRRG